MTSPNMVLRQIELGPMMNFIYLIGCAETREAAVIDPAWDVDRILKTAREADLKINRIFLTHGHPDHMNGLEAMLEATDAKVYVHAEETDYMRLAAELFQVPVEFMNRRSGNFQTVSDGEEVLVGSLPVKLLHTPGHTPGSQCFLVGNNLLSGDTLFINACGRVDLPGGDPEKMWWSLNRRLRALSDDTILYPGHNYSDLPVSTIGEQKQHNPYMQYSSLDDFLRAMSA